MGKLEVYPARHLHWGDLEGEATRAKLHGRKGGWQECERLQKRGSAVATKEDDKSGSRLGNKRVRSKRRP